MTETEWLSADDPGFMLDEIENRVSDRKLRLFAVACCRRLGPLLAHARGRAAVEIVEQDAEGLVSPQEYAVALEAAAQGAEEDADAGEPTAATAAWLIAYSPPFDAAYTCGHVSVLVDRESMRHELDWWATHEREGEEEARHQVALLHCIVGNPYRPASVSPSWLAWNGGAVAALGRAIYDERAVDRLPALADALVTAGCHDAAILAHCHHPGPHARGCWVIDLLLGKS